MTRRYVVSEDGRPFAEVHASTALEAIEMACRKVDGHDPADCTAWSFVTYTKPLSVPSREGRTPSRLVE